MDRIKIENFKRDQPDSDFPSYRALHPDEAESLRKSLLLRLNIQPSTSPLDLVKTVSNRSMLVEHADADKEAFDLSGVLSSLGIQPKEAVFINWYRYDCIDQMKIAELSRYFHDIWYPGADDIDVFDESLDWILSVGYSGPVSILKL